MSRVLKSVLLTINLILLAACGAVTPEPVSTVEPTSAPSLTPVIPTSTSTQTATRTTSPTAPALTSTPVISSTSITSRTDSVEQTQEAEEFCYQDPRKVLDDYLTFLYRGDYEKAARLYGGIGDYPNYREIPPNTGEEESLKIEAESLSSFCDGFGTCLRHNIVREEPISDIETVFTVYFYKDGGDIFTFVSPITDDKGYAHFEIVGPEFYFRVRKTKGCFKSLDVPPITP
jgi:hypothetical protein